MKILNLYAGIGGNRRLWGDKHQITAVENDEKIAHIYSDYFPNDEIVIADAHEYLLKHFDKFDFIWSSPPCPTHSDIRRMAVTSGMYKAKYPDMKLYEEIILLKHFADCKWVVENVVPYYEPLIPAQKLERHLFWTNFWITPIKLEDERKHRQIVGRNEVYGFNLKNYNVKDKRQLLRNLVNPALGYHILQEAFKTNKTLI